MPVSLVIFHVYTPVLKHTQIDLYLFSKVPISVKVLFSLKLTAIPTEGYNTTDRNSWIGLVILFFLSSYLATVGRKPLTYLVTTHHRIEDDFHLQK